MRLPEAVKQLHQFFCLGRCLFHRNDNATETHLVHIRDFQSAAVREHLEFFKRVKELSRVGDRTPCQKKAYDFDLGKTQLQDAFSCNKTGARH